MTDVTGQSPATSGPTSLAARTAERWSSEAATALMREIIDDLSPEKDPLERETRLVEDLGYHSLAMLELAFSLEDEFVLPTINEATARAIRTVGDVEDHVLGVLSNLGRLKD